MFTIAIPAFSNKFLLPYNFDIIFMPAPEVFSFNWTFNYIFQVLLTGIIEVFYLMYIPFVMMTMNHSCYEVDLILTYVSKLTEAKKQSFDNDFDKNLIVTVDVISSFIKWQNRLRKLFRFNFLIEFAVITIMFSSFA